MFLSQLTNKEILSSNAVKGVCRGLGISLKSLSVKYLLCASAPERSAPDFALSISAVKSADRQIVLSNLRPVFPKNCARVVVGAPVYSAEGIYLGKVIDLEIENLVATKLFTDRGEEYPALLICACQDAVFLRKQPIYPLTQRIPAPVLSDFSTEQAPFVNKQILRRTIEKSGLIRLTSSLAPFYVFLAD